MTWRTRRTFLKGSAIAAGEALLPIRSTHATNIVGGLTEADGPIAATIATGNVGEPISKYLYGMFIEHAEGLIYRTLWSEMLDDRKFYFPISSVEAAKPATPGILTTLRKWQPIGADEFVSMDRVDPYVGEQSPLVRVEGATPHGIQQSGLALQKQRTYEGRVILAASPGVVVNVSLIWGSGARDRQTIAFSTLRIAHTSMPLHFVAQANTENARLEITGTGTGSFRIGAVSLMPADNIQGFRSDTTQLLKQLNSGFYRLPGGNFLSDHDWRNGIGEIDKRPPTWDNAWKVMQTNDVGIDEFMILCALLDVEPYVSVNAGLADDRSAAELVEYANGSVHSRMGALRAANGHPEPYRIRYWNVGNEPYGWWQIGHTALRYFVMKHNAFAKAMRKVDPSITVLASGAMPDEMTTTGNARLVTGKVQVEFGTESDWTGGLLANCWGQFDGLSEHWYTHIGKRFDMNLGKVDPFRFGTTTQPHLYGFVPVEESFIDWARRPANRVRCKAEAWEEYKRRFPAIIDKKIFVAIDEWAYDRGDPTLRLALSYAMVFHEMFRHTDFIKMSAYTFGTDCLDYDSTGAILNSNGLLFKLYREHFGTLPVEVTGNSPQPAPKWPIGGDQPKVNAGSSTYPMDVVAALTEDRESLTVGVVNPTEFIQRLDLKIVGMKFAGSFGHSQMTASHLNASNRLGKEPEVVVTHRSLMEQSGAISIEPISINIYEFRRGS